MLRHDYRCAKCGFTFEVLFYQIADFRREWPCGNCGGVAVQIWLQAPGLAGVEEPSSRGVSRTFQPGMDLQSGRWFNTRAERDRYLKRRGLVALGPEEYNRSQKAAKEDPEPDFSGLVPAMKDAYEQVQAGKGEQHTIVDAEKLKVMEAK